MTELISRNGFGVGYGLMLTGLIVLLSGLDIDSYVSTRTRRTLASREGIFILSNPGHLIVAVGLAMTVIGACLGPYSRWVLPSRSRLVAFVSTVRRACARGYGFLRLGERTQFAVA